MSSSEDRDEYGWPRPDEDLDARWEDRAARWTPGQIRENVPVQQGRAPRLPTGSWRKADRALEAASTDDGEFWRCRETGCRRFAGPYGSFMNTIEDARDHRNLAHPPQERQTRTRGRSR